MNNCDFTKTSAQVEREVLSLIDEVDRSLDASNGDSDRKGQLALNALASLVVVFASILGLEHFVGKANVAAEASVPSEVHGINISNRELEALRVYLGRIESDVNRLNEVKEKVAPSMAIDQQVGSIRNAVTDSRRVLGLTLPQAAVEPQ